MDNYQAQEKQEIEIDVLHLIKILWQKAWIIILVMIVFGAATFVGVKVMVEPTYQSSAMMYVNSSNISLGSAKLNITSAELSAAKSLVDVYGIILTSRTTLEQVIEEADLSYGYNQLKKMISTGSVNNTEIFRVKATSTDPAEAQKIASTITRILPKRISEIVEGTSVNIVDFPVVESKKVAPNTTKIAVIGMLIGAVLACGIIIVVDLMDNTVRNEEYLLQKYQIPVLAVIPNMNSKKSAGYYYSKKKSEK